MSEEIQRALEEYLLGLLKVLGETAQIQYSQETDKELYINLQGIQTFDGVDPKPLRALGYLAEISLRRKLGANIKVHLDVNNQQARRLAELQQLARRLAEEALRESKRIQLDPMETHDRRVIHEALSDFHGVRTYSEGQGVERHVIIEPSLPGQNPLPEGSTEVGPDEDEHDK
jgi:spoIIIJ-associated protein